MRTKLIFSLFLLSTISFGQSLSSLNLNYLYDPQQEVRLSMEVVKEANQLSILFQLQGNTNQNAIENYKIDWQQCESFNSRQGIAIEQAPIELPTVSMINDHTQDLLNSLHNISNLMDLLRNWTFKEGGML